jgi:hypothetical protein
MDLNYLLHRQQVERSRARSAGSDQARGAHARLAALYETRIERITGGRLTFLRCRDQLLIQPLSGFPQ